MFLPYRGDFATSQPVSLFVVVDERGNYAKIEYTTILLCSI